MLSTPEVGARSESASARELSYQAGSAGTIGIFCSDVRGAVPRRVTESLGDWYSRQRMGRNVRV